MVEIIPYQEHWPVEFREIAARLRRRLAVRLADPKSYPDVKDPAVDLIYFAAEDWAASTGWQIGPSDA